MIILLGGQKGGAGKSTIACNLAGMLTNAGEDVILVDSDSQRSASRWCGERKTGYSNLQKINSTQQVDMDIDDALVDFDKRFNYVVVDAAGRDSRELATALLVCHVVLMPFRPSSFDIVTLPHMAALIKASRRVNPKLKAMAFVNSAPTNTQNIDTMSARDAIAEFPEIILLNTTIYDRRIYRDSMAEGLTAIEMTDKSTSAMAAKTEIKNLLEEVLSEAA